MHLSLADNDMHSQVPPKGRPVGKVSSTFVTSVWLFSTVYTRVNAQFVGGSEASTTHRTGMSSLVGVDQHVIPQRTALCKRRLTQSARVRSLASVCTTMGPQVGGTFKASTTHRADVRSGIAVCLLMLTQQLDPAKLSATFYACHGLEWHVWSLVSTEVAGITEATTTLRTQIRLFTAVNSQMKNRLMSLRHHQTTHVTDVLQYTPWWRSSQYSMRLQVSAKQRRRRKSLVTVSTDEWLDSSMSPVFVSHQVTELSEASWTLCTDVWAVSSVRSNVQIQRWWSGKLLATMWTRPASATPTQTVHCLQTNNFMNKPHSTKHEHILTIRWMTLCAGNTWQLNVSVLMTYETWQ